MHSSIWFEIVFGILGIHNIIIIHILLKDMTKNIIILNFVIHYENHHLHSIEFM